VAVVLQLLVVGAGAYLLGFNAGYRAGATDRSLDQVLGWLREAAAEPRARDVVPGSHEPTWRTTGRLVPGADRVPGGDVRWSR